MIMLFTREYGKISAGTSLGERGKNKSTLALQHFTFGRYSLHSMQSGYNIDSAEVIKSFYGIGEDVDKFLNGAYILEFTERVLEENVPMKGIFDLLLEFFEVLEKREKGFGTLVLAYQIRLFRYLGIMPELDRCTLCGNPSAGSAPAGFSVTDGGIVCEECRGENPSLHEIDADMINALKYFSSNSLRKLENIALNSTTGRKLQQIVRDYAAYYLDISNIKSESLI